MPAQPSLCSQTFIPVEVRDVVAGSALDGTSDAVVRAALAAARAARARLHVVHAVELPPVPPFPEGVWATPAAAVEDTGERREQLLAQLRRLGAEGNEVEATVVIGPAHRALLEAAEAHGADLIVVGATRAGRFLERLLGTTADRVLRKAPCAVLMVRGNLALPPERVLAPVDLTTLSADALRLGLYLLSRLGAGTRVTALHALTFFEHLAISRSAAPPLPEGEVERAAEAALAAVVESCREAAPLDVEPKLRCGDPRVEILRELEEARPDLVVMGTHAHDPLDRLLLGSVAATVARHAPGSMLLIPPEAVVASTIAETVAQEAAI